MKRDVSRYSNMSSEDCDKLFAMRNKAIYYFSEFLEYGDRLKLYEALKLALYAQDDESVLKKIRDLLEV
jgi:hypothetical protein